MVSRWSLYRPEWAAYHLRRTCIITSACPVWKRKIMNIQQYVRQAKLGHLLDPSHENALANKGIDMLRIPASINIPSIDEP
eukprot:9558692-Karenia_brevis.AAC.1